MEFTRNRFQQLGDYAQVNNKQYIPIIQAFGLPKDPMKIRRFCTQGESRYLIYTSILAQAHSLFFWAHFASDTAWINSTLQPLVDELKTYIPAISQNAIAQVIPSNSAIQARIYQKPQSQEYFLIAVNHSNHDVLSQMSIKARIKANLAQVVTENRTLRLSQGLIRDRFTPYQVHVYEVSSD